MGMPKVYAIRFASKEGSPWYLAPHAEGAGYGEVSMVNQASLLEDIGEVNWHLDRLVKGGHRREDLSVFPVTLTVWPEPI